MKKTKSATKRTTTTVTTTPVKSTKTVKTMKTTTTPTTTKVDKVKVSTTTTAKTFLKEYAAAVKAGTATYVTEGKSKVKRASVGMMVRWFKANRSKAINAGWFGRALNQDAKKDLVTMKVDGKKRNAYKVS